MSYEIVTKISKATAKTFEYIVDKYNLPDEAYEEFMEFYKKELDKKDG